jgi:tetratricopeptide (TPR) repeat protein
MAIDKSRTSPLMKTGIILLSAVFVLGIGFAGLSGLQSCTPAAPLLPGGASTSTASSESTPTIALKYAATVQALEASLTVNPKDYDLLVEQADTYFSWAYDVQQTMPTSESPTANPLWVTARGYYQRAVAVKATDATTLGDYAITLFYSGETTAAISMGEKSRTLDPKLTQNLYNLGNYYAAAGQNAKAIEAFKAYISADATGQLVQQAQSNITALGGQ